MARLTRTSSFRIAILYAGLFVLSVSGLFAIVYWSALRTVSQQIDQSVDEEIEEVLAGAPAGDMASLQRLVAELASSPTSMKYVLEDSEGRKLAGNLASMSVVSGERSFKADRNLSRHRFIRGRGEVIPGGYLFVGTSDYQMREMEISFTRTFVLGLAATLLLALAGGVVMSLGVLRRVESIGRCSRDIIAGDLARRIPLRGSGDEFDQLAMNFNTMLDRVQALMAGMQQVSADIAHDLRTPLTRVRQRLELARRRADTVDGLHVALDRSIDDVDTILRSFSALLRIAQIEAGTRRSGFVKLDLAALLATLVETYQPVAEENGQFLEPFTGLPLVIEGDRELLVQMFANLIENAVRHTPRATRIAVRIEAGRAVVRDNGAGIPAASRANVLNRFVRLENSQATPGDGLGLSLVAAIAQLHDASLSLEDAEPGLRVALRFPPLGAS